MSFGYIPLNDMCEYKKLKICKNFYLAQVIFKDKEGKIICRDSWVDDEYKDVPSVADYELTLKNTDDSFRDQLNRGDLILWFRCKAFPDGIPKDIEENKIKHIDPVEGDNGIIYEPRD